MTQNQTDSIPLNVPLVLVGVIWKQDAVFKHIDEDGVDLEFHHFLNVSPFLLPKNWLLHYRILPFLTKSIHMPRFGFFFHLDGLTWKIYRLLWKVNSLPDGSYCRMFLDCPFARNNRWQLHRLIYLQLPLPLLLILKGKFVLRKFQLL